MEGSCEGGSECVELNRTLRLGEFDKYSLETENTFSGAIDDKLANMQKFGSKYTSWYVCVT